MTPHEQESFDRGVRQAVTAVSAVPPTARVTCYTLSLLPEGPDQLVWSTVVEYRGHGLWAVRCGSLVLNADGQWEYEPSPSGRGDAFLARCRFSEQEALRLAHDALPHIKVNGLTAQDVLDRRRQA